MLRVALNELRCTLKDQEERASEAVVGVEAAAVRQNKPTTTNDIGIGICIHLFMLRIVLNELRSTLKDQEKRAEEKMAEMEAAAVRPK